MIRISWSGLRTHEECRQKGYLTRTKKLATLADKRNFLPGTVTDRVVRNWLLNDPLDHLGEMPDMVTAAIDAAKVELTDSGEGVVRWRDSGDRAIVEAECQEAVRLIEPDLLKYVVPYEYQPDFRFDAPVKLKNPKTGRMELINLIGYMDILVRDDKGRFWVWDVKHTKDNSYWRKTIGQLGFYDLAVEMLFGQPTAMTGLMQPLCKKPRQTYQPSQESRAQLMQRISAMASDIWNENYTPLEGKGSVCNWCSAKHACVKFQPVMDSKGRKRLSL